MRYIYYLLNDHEAEQRRGIKEFLSSRGVYPGDCTALQSEFAYNDPEYDSGVQDTISNLRDGDVLYVWDFSYLARSLERLYANLLMGVNGGVSFIQCLDGAVASNDSAESIAIVNAIGIASRIELKVSPVQRREKFTTHKTTKEKALPKKTIERHSKILDTNKIVIRRYSEKSVLVCGDSREYKDAIRGLGGIFNPKIDNGRAAWIVSLRKLKQLREVLAVADYVVLQDCYVSGKDYTKQY